MKEQVLTFVSDKRGESPGAIMSDGHKDYMVKLGLPWSHAHYTINSYEDLNILIHNMSKRACEEKMFFNLAEAVGNGEYILPKTNVIMMKPENYQESSCGVELKLARKFQIRNINSAESPGDTQEIIDEINNADIAHFTSELITPYQDIGMIYQYHIESATGDLRQSGYRNDSVPIEPRGMGAFFAISCFTGNYDCIGNTGGNAGISTDTYQVIIVDGGNIRISPDVIINPMPVSSNQQEWLSYENLSNEGKKEASETFARIIDLPEASIRRLITNDEQFIQIGVYTEAEVTEAIEQFKKQQLKLVEVFYDKMQEENCITPKINTLRGIIKTKEAERQAKEMLSRAASSFELLSTSVDKSILPKRKVALSIDTTDSIESDEYVTSGSTSSESSDDSRGFLQRHKKARNEKENITPKNRRITKWSNARR